jgi:hypothetical protein
MIFVPHRKYLWKSTAGYGDSFTYWFTEQLSTKDKAAVTARSAVMSPPCVLLAPLEWVLVATYKRPMNQITNPHGVYSR